MCCRLNNQYSVTIDMIVFVSVYVYSSMSVLVILIAILIFMLQCLKVWMFKQIIQSEQVTYKKKLINKWLNVSYPKWNIPKLNNWLIMYYPKHTKICQNSTNMIVRHERTRAKYISHKSWVLLVMYWLNIIIHSVNHIIWKECTRLSY